VKVSSVDTGLYAAEDDLFGRIYVAHRDRLSIYRRGIHRRLELLQASYSLEDAELLSLDVVVDCGANIGELGLVLPNASQYVAAEPDPAAFIALERNCRSGRTVLLPIALSDYDGYGTFEQVTATGDSHLRASDRNAMSGDLQVRVQRLDTVVRDLGLEQIDLLKVEAEGWEPEVLRGAAETLGITRYVAIDFGPERDGQDTAAQTLNILYESGFRVKDTKVMRGRALLERRSGN
jgi:FkbM family methyltransferase